LQFSGLNLVLALFKFVILLFSISLHDCAQAWMASRLGDHTARLEGRITLNPAKHLDPFGTFLYPALMIFGPVFGIPLFGGGGVIMGWGRPVQVITRNLKKITRDDNLITLAGPAANLLLAFMSFLFLLVLIFAIPGGRDAVIGIFLGQISINGASAVQALALLAYLAIQINLGLIFFNFLPVPPLDASRILRNMLPYNALQTYDNIARFAMILIFFLGSFVVGIFLGPAMAIVNGLLALILTGGAR
jgi:Zn-dependent protease